MAQPSELGNRPRPDSIIRPVNPAHAAAVNGFLQEAISAVKVGHRVATAHLDDGNLRASDDAIRSNGETLDFIMAGNVGEWPGVEPSVTSARFDDKVQLKDIGKMPEEYVGLLRRVLTIQADCEIGGPHLYVDHVIPGAPTRAKQVVVERTAIEEVDHYRKMAVLAADVGQDVSHVLSHGNMKRYVEAFRTQIKDWTGFAVFGFLVDRVGKYQLDEFLDGSYQPLDRIVRTMHDEEIGHIEYGTNETADLAARGGESKDRVQAAVDYWYPKSLDMFGMSESARSERFIYWGLKRRTNAQARDEYMAEVDPLIAQMGLVVPNPQEGRLYL